MKLSQAPQLIHFRLPVSHNGKKGHVMDYFNGARVWVTFDERLTHDLPMTEVEVDLTSPLVKARALQVLAREAYPHVHFREQEIRFCVTENHGQWYIYVPGTGLLRYGESTYKKTEAEALEIFLTSKRPFQYMHPYVLTWLGKLIHWFAFWAL